MVFGVGFSVCVGCELGCCAHVLSAKANATNETRRRRNMRSPLSSHSSANSCAPQLWHSRKHHILPSAPQKFLGNRDALGPDPKPVMPNARRTDQIRIFAQRY